MEEKATVSWGLSHIFLTIFFYNFAGFMVVPVITEVSLAALCPGEDECSLAIYLSGLQQGISGIGSLVLMPLIGNFSDHYGRKFLLTFPLTLAIFPPVILAYSRKKEFFYAYYVLQTIAATICDGTVFCISHAYLADNVAEQRRSSAFGILAGMASCAFVFGNLLTRFLPTTDAVFQVAAAMAIISVVYMRIFVKESKIEVTPATSQIEETFECLLENQKPSSTSPSLCDSFSLLKSSWTFSQTAIVAFLSMLSELGLDSALLYYLKAEFGFNTHQFANLLIFQGAVGIISQIIVMPMLAWIVNEEKLLAIGLAFYSMHMFLVALSWSSWVIYLASSLLLLAVLITPSLRSIVSNQVSPNEQGKAQGCISSLYSFATIISPLIFSPLTALFLSDHAPFRFPGFSVMCAALSMMIAFILSTMIKVTRTTPSHPTSDSKTDEYEPVDV